ncbi:MAG: RNA-binding protein [Gemmatimonadetes bacterium]|nr:MAG: RNA-binding protein [Gemmatimonadota bacterium]
MTTPGVRAINCCSIGSLGDCRISADVAPCGAPAWLIGVGRSVAFGPECEQAASKAASTRPPLTWRRGRDDVTVRTDVSDMKASSLARRDPRSHAPRRAAKSRWAERLVCLLAFAFALDGCRRPAEPPALFERLAPAATGVTFENRVPEDTALNILNFLYYYNGGGVAAGDVDGDGRPDLYFTSNLGSDRLYLNRGGYRFEDVTARAGVAGPSGWKTGVTMADVNGDGRLDIYVSTVSYRGLHGRNALYLNNGDGTFTDRAHDLGIDFEGYGTQAAFFDYDGDGDLDLFVLSFSTHDDQMSGAPRRDVHASRGGGRLYRNDRGHFVDVSADAGIYGGADGFGLGVVVSDVDLDGCPDVYVADDFQENDFLYHNNCDGTFRESIARATGHTSRFSMGVDAADVNDDGRPDIVVADMLPDDESILKTSASTEDYALSELRTRAGYHPQYARNTLQLNRGDVRFSEIGLLAGVHATDWSWAPLLADLDDDGRKDLFVSSGIYRRPNDLDYIELVGQPSVQATLSDTITSANLALLRRMPHVAARNHVFRNTGDLRFADVTSAWGLDQRGFSNGAVYVDLDNRGTLDLVVNEIDAPASIYRNRGRSQTGNASLTVTLRGAGGNTAGIGAKLFVRSGGRTQLVEQSPTRGFQSSVDPRLHIGLGRATVADSVTVVWPDRRFQVLTQVPANRPLVLSQRDASGKWTPPPPPPPMFREVSAERGVDVRHVENAFVDFEREPLVPRMLSTEGPALAVADVDGDGLDDLFLGGSVRRAGQLLLQRRDGTFHPSEQPSIAADSIAEDVDAVFFDANGDRSPDLYVVSAGNQFEIPAAPMRGRLYLNDGHGRFTRDVDAIPELYDNGGCVAAGDFDGDGHVDLFLGARSVPGRYGVSPKSHLLRNNGHGKFLDVTPERAPGLSDAGMITSAAWFDYDGDHRLDLVVVGEWTPVRVFHQEQGRLVERTAQVGLEGSEGWWNTVTVADVDGDAKPDLVLGNLGLNSYVTASRAEPARLYLGDFAHDGRITPILTLARHDGDHPVATRDELIRAIPELRRRFPTYASFGASTIDRIVPEADLRSSRTLVARTFASAIARNEGQGRFELQPLPAEAQIAPVQAIIAEDFDRDGRADLLLGGNFYGVPPIQGRYDASYGLLLRGMGDGRFAAIDMTQSGIEITGQIRRLRTLRTAAGPLVAVARNGDRLLLLQPVPTGTRPLSSGARSRDPQSSSRAKSRDLHLPPSSRVPSR